jgi:sensor histidine kinase YesM
MSSLAWFRSLPLDLKIYYILCLFIVIVCVSAWNSALVLIIWCVIALAISFVLSHLILKKWYTLSLPASFVLAQILLVASIRSQSLPQEKKQMMIKILKPFS